MADLRKVLTSIRPIRTSGILPTDPSNQYQASKSDRALFYNAEGFLDLASPPVQSPFIIKQVSTEAEARANSGASCLFGSYFGSSDPFVVPPFVIGPQRSMIILDGPSVIDLPTPGQMVAYLRDAFPAMTQPGLSWEVTIVNNDPIDDITLDFTGIPAGQTLYTAGKVVAPSIDRVLNRGQSTRLRIIVLSVVPGSEELFYIFQ